MPHFLSIWESGRIPYIKVLQREFSGLISGYKIIMVKSALQTTSFSYTLDVIYPTALKVFIADTFDLTEEQVRKSST